MAYQNKLLFRDDTNDDGSTPSHGGTYQSPDIISHDQIADPQTRAFRFVCARREPAGVQRKQDQFRVHAREEPRLDAAGGLPPPVPSRRQLVHDAQRVARKRYENPCWRSIRQGQRNQ